MTNYSVYTLLLQQTKMTKTVGSRNHLLDVNLQSTHKTTDVSFHYLFLQICFLIKAILCEHLCPKWETWKHTPFFTLYISSPVLQILSLNYISTPSSPCTLTNTFLDQVPISYSLEDFTNLPRGLLSCLTPQTHLHVTSKGSFYKESLILLYVYLTFFYGNQGIL